MVRKPERVMCVTRNESIKAIKSNQLALGFQLVFFFFKQKKMTCWPLKKKLLQLYGRARCLKLKFEQEVEEVKDTRQ